MKRLPIFLNIALLFLMTHSQALSQDKQRSSVVSGNHDDFTLRIQYTGRLLGYFRQQLTQSQLDCITSHYEGCASPTMQPAIAPKALGRVRQVWCATRGKDDDPTCDLSSDRMDLLVGLGDNFAPQLAARLRWFWWNDCSGAAKNGPACKQQFLPTKYDSICNLPPLNNFAFEAKNGVAGIKYSRECEPAPITLEPPGATYSIEDSVANFALLSGYRALVPGREDFQYGAAWLQKMAVSLAETSNNHSLHMLAANLRVRPCGDHSTVSNCTKVKEQTSPPLALARPACPLFFDPHLPTKLPNDCEPKSTSEQDQTDVGYTITTVRDEAGNERKVLIIGLVDGPSVVDPNADLSREISINKQILSNSRCSSLSYTADCKRYKITVTKPAEELRKILYATADTKQGHNDIAFRIVLAQMPRASALELATLYGRRSRFCIEKATDGTIKSMDYAPVDGTCVSQYPRKRYDADVVLPPLDVVISEAQDGRSTEIENTQYFADGSLDHTRAFLATPHSGYNNAVGKIQLPVSTLAVHHGADSVEFDNKGNWYASREISGTPVGKDCDGPTKSEDPRYCIVRTLQSVTHADVALLQNRDVFPYGSLLSDDVQEINAVCSGLPNIADCQNVIRLEELLWKDDLPTIVDLTGKQLQSALTQSETFYSNDLQSENRDEVGEWIYSFGIVRPEGPSQPTGYASQFMSDNLCSDPGQSKADSSAARNQPRAVYCVDGVPVDDNRVYHVATNAGLANNDMLFPGISTRNAGTEEDLAGAPESGVKFVGPRGPMLSNAIFAGHPGNVSSSERKAQERDHQQRDVFHLSLLNAEGSYASYHPNLSATELPAVFGGVVDTRVTKQSILQIIGSDNLRVLEEGESWDYGGLQTLDFNLSKTGNPQGGVPILNYSANNFTVGPLVQIHLGPHLYHPFLDRSKGLQSWKITLSPALFQTQLNGNTFAFNYDTQFKSLIPNQNQYVARPQSGVLSKAGLRYEYNDGGLWPDKGSYFELGYENNYYYNAIDTLTLVNGSTALPPCDLTASLSFSLCVKNIQNSKNPPPVVVGPQTKFIGGYTNLRLGGLYLDTSLQEKITRAKLPAGHLSALLQSKGDYFFRQAYSSAYTSQTYYDFNTSFSLLVPIVGNLTIGPKYTLFLYENLNTWHSLTANSYTIDVRYTLDYYRPVKLKGILKYTSPQSAPAPATGDTSMQGGTVAK